MNGSDVPLQHLQTVFQMDWPVVGGYKSAVLESLQVQNWEPVFYEAEADPTPPLWPDRPRLDILIIFTDESWIRWHPSGKLIWSTEAQPTPAMQTQLNRTRKLHDALGKSKRS